MARFYDLLQKSVIMRFLIAGGTVGVYLYIVVQGQAPPDDFVEIVRWVVGFYFMTEAARVAGQGAISAMAGRGRF